MALHKWESNSEKKKNVAEMNQIKEINHEYTWKVIIIIVIIINIIIIIIIIIIIVTLGSGCAGHNKEDVIFIIINIF